MFPRIRRQLRRKVKIIKKKKPKQQKRRRAAPSAGSVIAKGVSTLLSYVPGGSYLKSLADFAFKAFGWNPAPRLLPSTNVQDSLNWLGMSCRFFITYNSIARTTHLGVVSNNQSNNGKMFMTQFEDAALISLLIKIIPTGKHSDRSGLIAAAFVPFNQDDENNTSSGIPTFQDIIGVPNSVQGPANRTLVISYRPDSPWIRDFHRLDKAFGVFQAAFYDPMRIDPRSQFTVDDFTCDIEISGVLKFKKPMLSGGWAQFSGSVIDKTGDSVARVDLGGGVYYLDSNNRIVERHGDIRHLYPGATCKRWSVPEPSDFEMVCHD